MSGTNFILPFCATDSGTNLLTQAQYLADSQRPIGHQPGTARSVLANKVLRQTAVMAAGLGQFIANEQADDVVDTLTPAEVAAMLLLAVRNAVSANIAASEFPAGTAILFLQASAPTNWTQDTSEMANGRAIHVVADSSGGSSGGVHNPTLCNVVAGHTHTMTTGGQSQSHTHTITETGHTHLLNAIVTGASGPDTWGAVHGFGPSDTTTYRTQTGTNSTTIGTSSQDHSHDGTTNVGSSNTNWAPKYTKAILCRKD